MLDIQCSNHIPTLFLLLQHFCFFVQNFIKLHLYRRKSIKPTLQPSSAQVYQHIIDNLFPLNFMEFNWLLACSISSEMYEKVWQSSSFIQTLTSYILLFLLWRNLDAVHCIALRIKLLVYNKRREKYQVKQDLRVRGQLQVSMRHIIQNGTSH